MVKLLSNNILCPFEWRYGSKAMRKVFSEETRFQKMLQVEVALAYGLAKAEIIPFKCYKVIKNKADLEELGGLERIREIEKNIKHEVAAMVQLLSSSLKECGAYVHLGATSNDIIDTAWALIIRDALKILEEKIIKILKMFMTLAEEHLDTLMIGRTHGQHALPITFGFKLMNHTYELAQSLERIVESHKRVLVFKMAGAVGTMAAWKNKGLIVEKAVSEYLNLEPAKITTQICSRDRYAELICDLAILASVLDRFATEIRNLQRTEIMEVAEGFSKKQIGSSTMPHKENPIFSEKISGLSKFVRGLCVSSLENIVLWHERDLSNSSLERIIIPHVFLAVDEILESTLNILENIKVFRNNMLKNIKLTQGRIMAEAVVMKLVEKGIPRLKAYNHVKILVKKSYKQSKPFKQMLLEDHLVKTMLSNSEIEEILNPKNYLGQYKEVFYRTKSYVEKIIENTLNTW